MVIKNEQYCSYVVLVKLQCYSHLHQSDYSVVGLAPLGWLYHSAMCHNIAQIQLKPRLDCGHNMSIMKLDPLSSRNQGRTFQPVY
jgi:hypothetical protein